MCVLIIVLVPHTCVYVCFNYCTGTIHVCIYVLIIVLVPHTCVYLCFNYCTGTIHVCMVLIIVLTSVHIQCNYVGRTQDNL